MHLANLQKIDGSVMLTVPSVFLEQLELEAGVSVELAINQGCLVVKPQSRPHYTLEELLAQCDATAELSLEERQWLNNQEVGKEVI